MVAAGASGGLLFFVGAGALVFGSVTAAVVTELGAAISGFLAQSFYKKDSEIREIMSKQEDKLHDANAALTAFDMASAIEDATERNRQKGRIISAMLNIPPDDSAQT